MYFGLVARCMNMNVEAEEVVSPPALMMSLDSPYRRARPAASLEVLAMRWETRSGLASLI
jgi:hypothetical protein